MKRRTVPALRGFRLTVAAIVPVVLSLVLAAEGEAQRKGFILNLGLGAGQTNYSSDGFSETKTAFATDFKIGYAPSNQLLIYYSNDASFFSPATDYLASSGLTAIGASYFLKPEGPSFFFQGSLGLSAYNMIDTGDATSVDGMTGIGLALGAGYEFARHWLVDLDLVFGRMDQDFGGSFNTRTIRVAFNWLLY
jgi:hypothetical protein